MGKNYVLSYNLENIDSFTIGTDVVSRILSLRYLFVFSSKSEHKRENVLENLKQIHFFRVAIPLKILKNSFGLQFFVKTDTYTVVDLYNVHISHSVFVWERLWDIRGFR